MKVYKCDFCNKIKTCKHKDIEGKEYDVCAACWSEVEKKLKGKGRDKPVEITPWVPSVPWYPVYPVYPYHYQDTTRWIPEPKYPTWTITCGSSSTRYANTTSAEKADLLGLVGMIDDVDPTDALDITLSN